MDYFPLKKGGPCTRLGSRYFHIIANSVNDTYLKMQDGHLYDFYN